MFQWVPIEINEIWNNSRWVQLGQKERRNVDENYQNNCVDSRNIGKRITYINFSDKTSQTKYVHCDNNLSTNSKRENKLKIITLLDWPFLSEELRAMFDLRKVNFYPLGFPRALIIHD